MSSRQFKMLQSADKHLTKRLFRYTGSGAILVNDYLHILVPKLSVPIDERDVGKLSSKCVCINLTKCIHNIFIIYFHLQTNTIQLL